MRQVALTLSLIFLSSFVAVLAEDLKVDAHQKVASDYFQALVSGDAKKANELSDAPFSLDRKKVLKTKEEVVAVHEKIVADKGKRKIPEFTIAKTDKAPALEFAVSAKYFAYRITIVGDDEAIDIYVTQGDDPKVIGFSD